MTMPKYLEKFLGDSFKDISEKLWYETVYYYIIDSKFSTRNRLDLFLKNQINNPDPDVLKLAKELRKGTKNYDELIIKILRWVHSNITYKSDTANFGKVEYWATAKETLMIKADDCDGLNALIHVLFRLASGEVLTDKGEVFAPSINTFFSCIGDVKLSDGSTTGHYWNIYFSPKTGRWYSIDATYYPNIVDISRGRAEFRLTDCLYKDVWYYFNSKYILRQIW